jgi:hypothetical protein
MTEYFVLRRLIANPSAERIPLPTSGGFLESPYNNRQMDTNNRQMDTTKSWIEEEFRLCDLGDERLNDRMKLILSDLVARPKASFPQACQGMASLKATYRFLCNPNVEPKEILIAHQHATIQRMKAYSIVLMVQDTCLLDYTSHPSTEGIGPLASKHKQGFLTHNTLAFLPNRLPLGVIHQENWAREIQDYAKLEDAKKREIKNKESQKWINSLQEVNNISSLCPETTLVSVGDRESDIYDFLHCKRANNVHFLIRAAQNRNLEVQKGEAKNLRGHLENSPLLGKTVLILPKRKKRATDKETLPSRSATISIRALEVNLLAPSHRSREKLPSGEKLPSICVTAILAREEHPPEGKESVDWLLLTTLPLMVGSELASALEFIDWYCVRWQIEIWHKVLKSGCDIEGRQLGHVDSLERCLALYSVVAWRVLYAVMLSRHVPDASCELLLEKEEWQGLYCHLHKCAIPPLEPPSLSVAVRWLGRLGGYLDRKSDPPPGVTVIWRGIQRLTDIAEMYCIMSQRGSETDGGGS